MRQIAIRSDRPIFGQSGRSSWPPMFGPFHEFIDKQNTKGKNAFKLRGGSQQEFGNDSALRCFSRGNTQKA